MEVALGPGEWTVEVSNNISAVRLVPFGLTFEGDGWPLGKESRAGRVP